MRWFCLVLLAGGMVAAAGAANGDEIMEAGKNNPQYKALRYREATSTARTPIRLAPGPQLFATTT